MMGMVQVVREERDKVCDELAIWKSDFKTAVRIAFKNMPEYLEILRIKPISPRTVKKVVPPVEEGTIIYQSGQSSETAQTVKTVQNVQADQVVVEETKGESNSSFN